MRIRESKLRRIIRRTILEAGVPNFKDWYAADRAEVAASRKKHPDAIVGDLMGKVFNGEMDGNPDLIYQEAQAECKKHGCPNKVDYVAEKVINAVLESGF